MEGEKKTCRKEERRGRRREWGKKTREERKVDLGKGRGRECKTKNNGELKECSCYANSLLVEECWCDKWLQYSNTCLSDF